MGRLNIVLRAAPGMESLSPSKTEKIERLVEYI